MPDDDGGPLAYFITWTSYGTWLHGDERGSVDRDHNVVGTDPLPAQPTRRDWLAARLSSAVMVLGDRARAVVDGAIREVSEHRGWCLLAINVCTNHVHVVLTADTSPDTALAQLKAWATRKLREDGLAAPAARVWTTGGSTRYLWNERDVEDACWYVTHGQDQPKPSRGP